MGLTITIIVCIGAISIFLLSEYKNWLDDFKDEEGDNIERR